MKTNALTITDMISAKKKGVAERRNKMRFIIGLIIGGCFGFVIVALMTAGRDER